MTTTKNTTAYPLQVWGLRILDANDECVHEEWFGEGTSSENYRRAEAREHELAAGNAYRAFLPDAPCHQLCGFMVLTMKRV